MGVRYQLMCGNKVLVDITGACFSRLWAEEEIKVLNPDITHIRLQTNNKYKKYNRDLSKVFGKFAHYRGNQAGTTFNISTKLPGWLVIVGLSMARMVIEEPEKVENIYNNNLYKNLTPWQRILLVHFRGASNNRNHVAIVYMDCIKQHEKRFLKYNSMWEHLEACGWDMDKLLKYPFGIKTWRIKISEHFLAPYMNQVNQYRWREK